MRPIGIACGGVLAAVAVAVAAISLTAGPDPVSAQGTVYTVTIENLTTGQPFTPPLLAVHTSGADLFTTGDAASSELQEIAENGNLDPMMALLDGSSAVSLVVAGSGPVMPGGSATLTVEVPDGSSLSWVSMLICTNDGFTGIDSLAVTGATTVTANAYDAGTEMNTEDFADIVPPCQALVSVSSDDEGTGMTVPSLAENGVVAAHSGVMGDDDLTEVHMWTDPVARVTISAGPTMTPPSTGSGGLLESPAGASMWSVAAAAIIVTIGLGTAVAVRRRV